jgi:hypothetical protein
MSVKLQGSRITLPIVYNLRNVDALFVAYYLKQQKVFWGAKIVVLR